MISYNIEKPPASKIDLERADMELKNLRQKMDAMQAVDTTIKVKLSISKA